MAGSAWFDCPPDPFGGDLHIARLEVHTAAYRRLAPPAAAGYNDREVAVELVREPTNEHDPNAVAVWCEGLQVGYMPRDRAAAWAPSLDDKRRRGVRVRAGARLGTEGGRGRVLDTYGWLRLPPDPADYARWEAERPAREAAAEADRATKERRKAERHAEAEATRDAREAARLGEQEARRHAKEQARAAAALIASERRASGLCVDCGAPIERVAGRGRPPMRCAVHAAEARERRGQGWA